MLPYYRYHVWSQALSVKLNGNPRSISNEGGVSWAV